MKFGIFYEISIPRPWERETERTVYENCLEQVRLADELGFDQVWAVEHHFLEEYSHCSAPELFLTASATASSSASPSSTTRSASPSAPPCSTSSPAAGSSSARAAPPPGRSWAA